MSEICSTLDRLLWEGKAEDALALLLEESSLEDISGEKAWNTYLSLSLDQTCQIAEVIYGLPFNQALLDFRERARLRMIADPPEDWEASDLEDLKEIEDWVKPLPRDQVLRGFMPTQIEKERRDPGSVGGMAKLLQEVRSMPLEDRLKALGDVQWFELATNEIVGSIGVLISWLPDWAAESQDEGFLRLLRKVADYASLSANSNSAWTQEDKEKLKAWCQESLPEVDEVPKPLSEEDRISAIRIFGGITDDRILDQRYAVPCKAYSKGERQDPPISVDGWKEMRDEEEWPSLLQADSPTTFLFILRDQLVHTSGCADFIIAVIGILIDSKA